jgi:hypothetical protein
MQAMDKRAARKAKMRGIGVKSVLLFDCSTMHTRRTAQGCGGQDFSEDGHD